MNTRLSNKKWVGALRWGGRLFGLAAAALFLCAPLYSQTNLGRISGAVTDQSGGAVAGAAVTVTDVERGVNRPLVTDGAGEYNAPSLTPGTYTVRAEFMGFKVTERQNILVQVGGDLRVDLELQPGEQAQTVTVTETLPMVNATNAVITSTLENKEVTDIPVEGGNYIFLYSLRPGLQARPGGGAQQNSSNGNRTQQNAWMLDGLFDTKVDNGGFMLSSTHGADGDQANILPTDAIQEIQFQQNPKAEYGWRPGAVANVGLKSGTNTLHGTAHLEGRDTSLVAANAFTPKTGLTAGKGVNSFLQSGATVGGKLIKDKLFYFGMFEWQRSFIQIPRALVVPTTASLSSGVPLSTAGKSGSFADAIADINTNAANTTHVPVSSLSAALAGCTNPLATTPAAAGCSSVNQGQVGSDASSALFGNDQAVGADGTTATASTVLNQLPLQHQTFNELIKVDYHPNDHNAINGEYFQGGGLAYSGTGTRNFWRNFGYGGGRVLRGVWTWTPNSTVVLDTRFGYDFISVPDATGDCPGSPFTSPNNGDYSKFGLVTGVPQVLPGTSTQFDLGSTIGIGTGTWSTCGFPLVNITGFAALATTAGVRNSNGYLQGVESVTWTRGHHVFKGGFEARWQKMDATNFGNQHGTIAFGNVPAFNTATALEDFMAGKASSTGDSLQVGSPVQLLYSHNYAFFFQDDWRLTPRITLNLGLRYEFQEPWFEGSGTNKYANFSVPSCPSPAAGAVVSCSGLVQQTNSQRVINGDKDTILPRVGVAWDVTGKGTSVLSLGGGIYYLGAVGQSIGTLGNDPTGFTFVRPNGTTFAGGGTINTATISLTPSNINWTKCVPTAPGSPTCTTATTTFGNIPNAPQCGNGIGANAPACTISATNPNLQMGYSIGWNLGFQHAFSHSLSWNVAYVGTHASKLWGIDNLNQPSVGFVSDSGTGIPATLCNPTGGVNAAALSAANCEQISRPFYFAPGQVTETPNGPIATAAAPGGVPTPWLPWFAKINYISNLFQSNYNALQTSLTQRLAHGITFNVSYTYEHALSDASTDAGTPQNASKPGLEYGNDLNDIRHRVTITGSYAIPGRHGFGQMLEGWQINTSIGLSGRLPISVQDTNSDLAGTGDNVRWDLFGNPYDFQPGAGALPCYGIAASTMAKQSNCTVVSGAAQGPWQTCLTDAATLGAGGTASLNSVGCYVSGSSAIIPPAKGTFGTMTLSELRGKGFRTWDMTVTHDWKLKERFDARFIAQIYNVDNRTEYAGYGANPNSPNTFGLAANTPDVQANSTVLGQGGPRRFNFGVKFTW